MHKDFFKLGSETLQNLHSFVSERFLCNRLKEVLTEQQTLPARRYQTLKSQPDQ